MAKTKATERLRAPLMYAFRSAAAAGDAKKQLDIRTDDGERVIASRRQTSSGRRNLSESALKGLLAEDLAALLNTTNLISAAPELIGDLEHVRASILNFGLDDMADKTIDERQRIAGIAKDMIKAFKKYEPRLIDRTIEVERDEENEQDLSIRFRVRSDMRADPMPMAIEFLTEVELDTGEIKVGHV